MAINIECGSIDITLLVKSLVTRSPAADRDFTLDQYYDIDPIDVSVDIVGDQLNKSIWPEVIEITLSPVGELKIGQILGGTPIEISIVPVADHFTVQPRKSNWIAWSKIGSLDFTIDRSNIAGERPLDWSGYVREIKKLDKQVVAYGDNGVSLLIPEDVKYGLQTIHRVGVVCKPVGTDFEHYFIDKTNRLYRLSQKGIELLDYSEYLSGLTNPRMALDLLTGIIYICDGSHGYVFSTNTGSFAEGPANVSGLGSRDGTLYVVSPAVIEMPRFRLRTDIYDFGTRKEKTVQTIEVGTDLTDKLRVMLESRLSNREDFIESMWTLVNPSGIAYIPCFGVEFRINLRSDIHEYMEIDYLKIGGTVHGFSGLEAIGQRYSPYGG